MLFSGDASKHVPMMSLRFVVALSGTKERAVPDPLDIDIPRNATIAKWLVSHRGSLGDRPVMPC